MTEPGSSVPEFVTLDEAAAMKTGTRVTFIPGVPALYALEEVAYLNDVCDRLGLDTMSAGNATAFAIEARKRGKTGRPGFTSSPVRPASRPCSTTRSGRETSG